MITSEMGDVAASLGGHEAYQAALDAGKTVLTYQQWLAVRTPSFKAWFGDWESSEIVGLHPETKEPQVVYRGEHGEPLKPLNTVRGTYTFSAGVADANLYSTHPSDIRHAATDSRLIPAFLRIKNPVTNDRDDPFLDFSTLIDVMGYDAALAIALRHDDDITYTGHWEEEYSERFDTVQELLEAEPEELSNLYCLAYYVLDNPESAAELAAAGFDGAVHGPHGGTHGDPENEAEEQTEFKIFYPGQARSAISFDQLLGPEPKPAPQPVAPVKVAAAAARAAPMDMPVVVAATPRTQAIGNMGWLRPADVEEELRENGLGWLIDNGGLVIHRSGDTLPGDLRMKRGIAGVALPGTGAIHINAGAHNYRDRPMTTLLHEAFHARVEPLLGSKGWCKLMDRLSLMYQRAQAGELRGPYWKAALARVNEAKAQGDTPSYATEVEEFGAYALDKYQAAPPVITRWVRDVTGTVKAWALKRFGVQLGDVTPAQLHKLAKSALKASHIGAGMARSHESIRAAAAMSAAGQEHQGEAAHARQANGLRVMVSGYEGVLSRNTAPDEKPWRVTWYEGPVASAQVAGHVAIDVEMAERLVRGQSAQVELDGWSLFIDPDDYAQERQTETPAFKGWFRDSKVVDVDNQPRIVYHATGADFDIFAPSEQGTYGRGMYFAESRRSAEAYLPGVTDNEHVIEAYLSLQNPWMVEGEFDSLAGAAEDVDSPIVESILALPRGRELLEDAKATGLMDFGHFGDKLQEHLKELGYDGIMARYSDDSMELVAFEPEQIKSATHNVGDFDPDSPDMFARRAYHGSPHEFDEFSVANIGKGEGNQAFGWGLYFSGRRAVAEWYHKNLSAVTPAHNTIDGKRITKAMLERLRVDDDPVVSGFFGSKLAARAAGIIPLSKALDDTVEFTQEQIDHYQAILDRRRDNPPVMSTYDDQHYHDVIGRLQAKIAGLEVLRSRLGHVPEQRRGAVYEVDIPDEDEYLDWDLPLSEQTAAVQEALRSGGVIADQEEAVSRFAEANQLERAEAEEFIDANVSLDASLTGKAFYDKLVNRYAAEAREALRQGVYIEDTFSWGQRKASELLSSMGVAGVKYLDGLSRNVGEGSHNFVVFDDARVRLAPGSLPERIKIDGKLRATRTSDGNRIHPDVDGIRNFWRWYGDSRLLDAKGRPQVSYHGTTKEFEAFDPTLSKSTGLFFSAGREYASIVAELDGARQPGAKVLPVFLKASNPKVIPSEAFSHASTREAQAAGHDALITLGEDGKPSQITVFAAEQVKSALGNAGTFDPAVPSMLARRAWHGSSSHFSEFSTAHVGTGEGNQSFGWGLYFSDSREVGEFYRRSVSSDRGFCFEGETGLSRAEVMERVDARFGTAFLDGVIRPSGLADRVMDDLTVITHPEDMPRRYLPGTERRAMLDTLREMISRPHPGALYEVDIPEDDEYLLWDKPLSQQPEPVRAALLAAGIPLPETLEPLSLHNGQFFYRGAVLTSDGDDWFYDKAGRYTGMAKGVDKMVELINHKAGPIKESELPRGSTLYADLSQKLGGDQAASEYLSGLGVAGIKYLDGLHRAAGEGTHNFVIFDGTAVAVRNRHWSGTPEQYANVAHLLAGGMSEADFRAHRESGLLLQLQTRTSAFSDIGVSVELARILREAARRSEGGLKDSRMSLADLNGARVGWIMSQSLPPEAAILPGRVRIRLGGNDHDIATTLRGMADSLDRGDIPAGLEVGSGVDLFAAPAPEQAHDEPAVGLTFH